MDPVWQREFKERMKDFNLSIKVRVSGGCFHREHSPEAYRIIDDLRRKATSSARFRILEHESGPEILVYLALGTAAISLTASLIQFVTAIINARSQGIKKGDLPKEHLEIIVRGYQEGDKYFEETALRVDPNSSIGREVLEKALRASTKKLLNSQRKRPSKKKKR
jgi:hypothetical protein